MEKTITIDGKQVRFKSTGATPLRYKAQFHKDFFAEILKLNSLKKVNKGDELKKEDIEMIDFDVLYNITWVMAKTADQTIPEPIEWLDQFNEFPLMDIVPKLQDLISASMQSKKKSSHPANNKKYQQKRS
jgi:type II secretory pathway component PulK